MSILSRNIRYLRREKSMSQEDVANMLGYKSYTTVQKWESGDSQPPLSTIEKLSKIFNVSTSDFLNTDLESNNAKRDKKKSQEIPEIIAAHFKDDAKLSEDDLSKIDSYISFLIEKNKDN